MAVQPHISEIVVRAAGIEWDSGNRDKCQKHGVSLATVESLFHRPLAVFPDPAHSEDEERFKAIGRTDEGRSVLIVFTLRTERIESFIRPISARYMHQREVDYYEEAAAKTEKRSGS
jgi:uncharacterized DUF497 family protein